MWGGTGSGTGAARSDVEEPHVGGIALDEGAALLDVVAHEDREGLVRVGGLVEGDLLEDPGRGVHGGLPQLVVVHLAQALVALDTAVLGQAAAGLRPGPELVVTLGVGVGELVLGVGPILLLAGKGHEEYQLIRGEKVPYSDKEVVNGYFSHLK